MQAMQYIAYGGPEKLRLAEIPEPVPAAGQIRVRVRATSINPIDWKLHSGMLRWVKPLRFPSTPCFDFAGVVEQTGPDTHRFSVGDQVFGMLPIGGLGAAAECLVVAEQYACRVPAGLSLETMAGLPLAGMTALQALRDQGRLEPEQSVLIIGAAGGVGHYAVQIGRLLGGRITAICGPGNLEFCQDLGAEAVLDYTQPGMKPPAAAFDLILDCAGHEGFGRWRDSLKPRGRFVTLLPALSLAFHALPARLFKGQRLSVTFVKPRAEDLHWLAEQVQAQGLRTIVEQVFPLVELPAAMAKSRLGHARGKIVVTIPA
ncbi:NAD(P)-dependent alcohol dehydrogenase [Candidatus Kaiserbacteria bacterium]|nr:NAD(P)-dependent alcohol dehydrogenase [Candidatus Kaiserbacteria bacterium]